MQTNQQNHQFMIRKAPLIRQETTVYLNDQLIELAIRELQHNESILDARLAAMEC